jgi:hypothetical protein
VELANIVHWLPQSATSTRGTYLCCALRAAEQCWEIRPPCRWALAGKWHIQHVCGEAANQDWLSDV